MSRIQAILFDRNRWSIPAVHAWLAAHNYRPIKELHETNHWIRARLEEPVGMMRIITLSPKENIRAVVMFGPGRTVRPGGRGSHPSLSPAARRRHNARRARHGGAGWGYLDSHPNLLGDLVTTALAGLAIAGVVTAVKKAKE